MVLTVVLVILIYAAAVITVYRRLIPGLPSEFARLPLLLLVAQALVFIGHFLVPQSWTFVYWLFHPDKELNIPSLLSSTQLALVSGAALAIACRAGFGTMACSTAKPGRSLSRQSWRPALMLCIQGCIAQVTKSACQRPTRTAGPSSTGAFRLAG